MILPISNNNVAIRFHTGYLSDQKSDIIVASKPHLLEFERWRVFYDHRTNEVAFRSMKTNGAYYLTTARKDSDNRIALKAIKESDLTYGMPNKNMHGERFRIEFDWNTGGCFIIATGKKDGKALSARP